MPSRMLAALVLVAGLLVACGGANEPTATSAGPTDTPSLRTPTGPPTGGSPPPGQGSPGTIPGQSPVATAEPGRTPAASPQPTHDDGQWPPPSIGFVQVASGFTNLTYLTHAGDDAGRIYLVEQRGTIRAGSTAGSFESEPFIDISDRVSAGGERGLLGLAFHPDYAANGRFFVNYNDLDGNTVVAEYHRAGEATAADPSSERVILQAGQPFPNHNGGMLAFGADGYLYISTGDGGSGGDPLGSGQDRSSLLGKILRIDIDVDGDDPYAIPSDNPFADAADGMRPEIWAYGLRNPWRFSFDRQAGHLFIADVGQNRWEEVNVEPAGEGGRNYGWNIMEGPDCFGGADCDMGGLTMPVAWYETGGNCAITGGYVYRGEAVPELRGAYLYADYCSGNVWALDGSAAIGATDLPVEVVEMGNAGINVTSFGEDQAGELYVVGAGGEVRRIVAGD